MAKNILIVDDSEVNRRILRKLLSPEYTVLEAEDGQVAMQLLWHGHQDVAAILLDISMPVMDGFEVLTQLQQNPTLSQIPVIVITGDTAHETEKKALAMGATDFATKPFDGDIIKRRLNNLIRLRETAALVNTLQKDRLTGLWNRETFFHKAGWAISRQPAGTYVLGCVDIDNFKVINDLYGTDKGDAVLKGLAGLLRQSGESTGGICGRIFADKFISLYPREAAASSDIGPQVLEARLFRDFGLPLTLSVGRYLVDDKSLDVSAMYDRACLAQNTVKGRYDVHVATYDEAMRNRLMREQEIVTDMDAALRDGQFETWFQPQYNHATGALIGAEALVRWRHPRRGLISPGYFIPVFERNGFIYELDKHVWASVCAQLRQWLDEGRAPLPVSMNVSRYDLFREDLVDTLTGLVKRHDLPVELVRLEITESAFAQSTEQVVAVVRQLIAHGFVIEIDDFGSGYSSLNTLKDVPAHIIKLDMRFLEKANGSNRSGNILESVVRMAKWLGMAVIAEGVEEAAHADFLRSIGCNYVQGFLYAKPMPAADYTALAGAAGKEATLAVLETTENLDNNTFWDPASLDTLIFNSYVGAATIFEWHGQTFELIRASKNFTRLISRAGMDIAEALKLDWAAHLDADGLRAMGEAVRDSLKSGDEVTGEYVFLNLPNCPEKTYLRSSLRVIASTGDRCLLYGTHENITAQRVAEGRRLAAEQDLRDTDEQLRFLNSTAHAILAQPDVEEGMHNVLRKILSHFQGTRAYIFELADDPALTNNTYEVCAEGVTPERANLQNLPASSYYFWWDTFRRGEYISIRDVASLPPERADERKVLQAQGIRSLIAIPLRRDGKVIGFAGVDDLSRNLAHLEHLQMLGDYLTVLLTRRDLIARIQNGELTLNLLTENIPGGLGTFALTPAGLRALYYNEGFFGFSGYTRAEYDALIRDTPFPLMFPEDRAVLLAALEKLRDSDTLDECRYRCRGKNGKLYWRSLRGHVQERRADGAIVFNVAEFDITELKRIETALRVRETEYRLAIEHSGGLIYRYNHADDSVDLPESVAHLFGLPCHVTDVPQSLIAHGMVADESVEAYRDFYKAMKRGVPSGDMITSRRTGDGGWRWFDCRFSTVRDDMGQPVTALIMFRDITEQREKEAVFAKWQQALRDRPQASYSLFRWNLSRDTVIDTVEGALLDFSIPPDCVNLDSQSHAYAQRHVHPEDAPAYLSTLHLNSLLDGYRHGRHVHTLEYREILPDRQTRWLGLTVELMEYPGSSDVCAYIMFENVDEKKKAELLAQAHAESDPLTGLLNRAAFELELNRILYENATMRHAFMMLDIDGFKIINDTLGHAAGDQALIDMADALRSLLRPGDVLGRLGGDEFIICFRDMQSDAGIKKKAAQICALLRKASRPEAQLTASVGVAVYPRDGETFEELYAKADTALYTVKGSGKDNYALFSGAMDNTEGTESSRLPARIGPKGVKRRMLIVDDDEVDRLFLAGLFKDEFIIDTARDGHAALIRLRHYGAAISVVLLDLLMPGIDGMTVLEKMQASLEMRTVPVVVVSAKDDYETSLKCIQRGASDFVTKPIDPALIHLRVDSAISKAENERLRAQNSYLLLQRNEDASYRAVLESTGMVVVEMDWGSGACTVDPSIKRHIAGSYDGRRLWQVLLADMVADAVTVKAMTDMVYTLANNRLADTSEMDVRLKTPSGRKHLFRMRALKQRNEFQLTDKVILTFNDLSVETKGK